MSKATVIMVQARLDSSRLPVKALHDLGGKPLVSRVMETLSALSCDSRVLVCDQASLQALAPFARMQSWEVFAGDRDNVLGRFCAAARHHGAAIIVRATGDNPLVSVEAAAACVEALVSAEADHCRMDGLAHGGGVEVVRASRLFALEAGSPSDWEREHVCPGIWQHPERYRCIVLEAPEHLRFPKVRMTLDTPDDYQVLRRYWALSPTPGYVDFCTRMHHEA